MAVILFTHIVLLKNGAMTEETGLLFDVVYDIFDDFLLEFHQWSDLPVDVKFHILKYLTFPTLRSIMFLNKECYNLVRRIKPKIDLHLRDAAYLPSKKQRKLAENHEWVELHIHWRKPGAGPEPVHDYPLMFVKDSKEGCYVQRLAYKGKPRKLSATKYSSNPITTATEVMFRLSKVMNIQATTISVRSPNADLQAVLAEQSSSQKIAKEHFTIRTDNEPLIIVEFLRFLKPGCGVSVVMENGSTELFHGLELFEHEIFRCARKITLHHWKVEMTDNQLVHLTANEISFNAPKITSEAINKLVLEWLEGRRKISSIQLDEVQTLDSTIILQNIDPAAIMLWKDFVKMTYNGTWRYFGDTPALVIKGPQGFLAVQTDTDTNSCHLVDVCLSS